MKLLLIADAGPTNLWWIREIERVLPLAAILRPDWNSLRPASATPQARRGRSLRSFVARWAKRARERYFGPADAQFLAQVRAELFGQNDLPSPAAPVWNVPWWQLNRPETVERVRALAPDLLLVCGAPLLRRELFAIPRLGAANLHFGIAPDYRGMHTVLFPWQAGDFARLGATLHYINEGIDAGPALFRVYPALTPADHLVSVEARIARLAARETAAFLRWLLDNPAAGRPAGKTFPGTGRLIRAQDRTILRDVRQRFRRVAPPVLPERVEVFYA